MNLARLLFRLNSDDRGNLSILFLLIVFVMMAILGLVFNTGQVITQKMHVQAAADAAAYSTAAWDARATNLITAGNIVNLRATSAEGLSFAVLYTLVEIPLDWADVLDDPFIYLTPVPEYIATVEVPAYLDFLFSTLPAVADGLTLSYTSEISDVYNFQEEVISNLPAVIESQRSKVQSYYGVSLHLSCPRDQQDTQKWFTPGVRPTSWSDIIPVTSVIRDRMIRDGETWDGSWSNSDTLQLIIFGNGVDNWQTGINIGVGIEAAARIFLSPSFHVLVTEDWLTEPGGLSFHISDADRLTHFSYIATASQPSPPDRLLPQITFRRRGSSTWNPFAMPRIAAYAQAESFNGNDANSDILTVPWVEVEHPTSPWRVWTVDGMYWRPRLVRSDGLPQALQADPNLASQFNGMNIQYQNQDFTSVNLH